jgi:pimeloyl-ACP methyl ester carboxylesterase
MELDRETVSRTSYAKSDETRQISLGVTKMLLTADGVRISAVHHSGSRDLAFVVVHGFTGSWRTPAISDVVTSLAAHGGVFGLDMRGHGASGGRSTVGADEIHDVQTVVDWARYAGYSSVVTVGFSMGGAVVVRHAALLGGVDAVVSVSSPGWWFYRGTPAMRRLHWIVERRLGRVVGRYAFHTRIDPDGWQAIPDPPSELAGRISPVPLLVVHGDQDGYFPIDHALALHAAAAEPRELWIEAGFGHAEVAATPELIDRIGRWVSGRVVPAPAVEFGVGYENGYENGGRSA